LEVAAMGGCLLTEDTLEHRALYGEDEEAVVYFSNQAELVVKTKQLLADPQKRERLRQKSHHTITSQGHTYRDRVSVLLTRVLAPESMARSFLESQKGREMR